MAENPQGLEKFIARQNRKRHLALVWARLAGLQPGMVAVDFGCGPAVLTLEYARIAGPAGIVYGVESSPAVAAELAKQNHPVRFLFQHYGSVLNLEQIPHIVFLTDTLHHLPDPITTLRAIHQSCGPDTVLFIAEYDPEGLGLVGAKPHRRMGKEFLLRLLDEAGFRHGEIIDSEDEHYTVLAYPQPAC